MADAKLNDGTKISTVSTSELNKKLGQSGKQDQRIKKELSKRVRPQNGVSALNVILNNLANTAQTQMVDRMSTKFEQWTKNIANQLLDVEDMLLDAEFELSMLENEL